MLISNPKMGFDMIIACSLSLCPESGKPFITCKNGQKNFDLSQIPEVPQEFRRFIQLRGSVFYEYTRSFGPDETIVDIIKFIDRFPPWDEVELDGDEVWTSLDHNKFYAAVEWMADSEVNYIVSWSY